MSNDISGPFETHSGPPFIYKVSFTIDSRTKKASVPTDLPNFIPILDKHACDLGIPFKSRKTENGYDLAFLKINDYETLLKSIENDIKKVFECNTQRINRYANSSPDHKTPSAE